ncbi:MAG: hypothetical protein COZ28_02430 [Candidatus Moranbacteria bacterium CG_4_10_14_3_um_filter_44_15]|nr:MAG: hypothetical protein COS72_00560 [Candidatus Moranbacteria bacterium CG06_land_8_20_14_3_00_43_56]PIV83841.1 MAG: hypothetical protein COW51_02875 [Candidatus Moranbacteria bacterium CG17_big_fil_post_rev_8_21_14_2_50_44_12]PIW93098.1 MAG: hypothetical protein COZ87_02970 [Candidatus Moranbacteria bacterium CG_4_8_14_3_um_filter_43_15]PIX90672.1 MAG: hypothetical protein COZ28_02430 [Candidatus Moranbacteria bacterium CG_4_10_14_3_um_filter_44_15]PJA86284.1 MAG: hypothetical protein CO1
MFPMTNLEKIFKQRWDYLILLFIVALAAAIRLYHFHDWLYFAMDQARDGMLTRETYENGASTLPLLGPRAAGTFLRLGPIFYYFQYISAKIFHSTDPAVLAYPDFLFSVLSIPLFFFFLRLYFQKAVSLLVTAVCAFSFIAIQYGRFSWNPNSIPFWILLVFFALLKFSRSKDGKQKYAWLAVMAVAWSVVSQLHFLVFVTIPILVVVFLAWNRNIKKTGLKGALLVLLILLLFYLPVILSDLKTGGDNVKQFVFALKNKPQADYSWPQKFFQNFINHGNYYTLYPTSYISRTGKTSMLAGLILIFATLLKMFWMFWEEKNESRKAFLRLIFIWFFGFFLLLVPFAFQIRPRFFFPVFFLPFVFFAFWFEWLLNWKKGKYLGWALAAVVFLAVLTLNSEATFSWYKSLAEEKDPEPWLGRMLVIQQFHNVKVSQLKKLSEYLRKRSAEEGKIFEIHGIMTYRVPVQYFLEADPPVDYGLITKSDKDSSKLYFAMTSDKDGYGAVPADIRAKFNLVATHSFSYRLKLYELELKEIQPEYKKEKKSDSGSSEEKKPRPKRKERVNWEDL